MWAAQVEAPLNLEVLLAFNVGDQWSLATRVSSENMGDAGEGSSWMGFKE